VSPPEAGTRLRIAKNFIALSGGEAIVRVFSLLFFVGVSRKLGPSDLGLLNIAAAIMAYIQIISDGGMTTPAQLELVNQPGARWKIVADTVAAQLIVAAAATLVTAVIVLSFSRSSSLSILILILLPSLIVQAMNISYFFQAAEQFKTVVKSRLIAQMAAAGGGLILLYAHLGINVVALSIWLGPLLGSIYLLRAASLQRGVNESGERHAPLGQAISSRVRVGLPYLGNGLLTQILISADVVAVGLFLGSSKAGIYAAAYRIAAVLFLPVTIMVSAVFPEFIRRASKTGAELQGAVRTTSNLAMAFVLPITAAILCGAGRLINFAYGTEYAKAIVPLRVLILFVPMAYVGSFMAQALVAANHQTSYLRINCVGATVALCVLLAGVPVWGLAAAAWSVTGTEAVVLLLLTHVCRTRLQINMATCLGRYGVVLAAQSASLYGLLRALEPGIAYAVWILIVVALTAFSQRDLFAEIVGWARQRGGQENQKQQ
jgi:O-antigen/teichoic acid export membrane protein